MARQEPILLAMGETLTSVVTRALDLVFAWPAKRFDGQSIEGHSTLRLILGPGDATAFSALDRARLSGLPSRTLVLPGVLWSDYWHPLYTADLDFASAPSLLPRTAAWLDKAPAQPSDIARLMALVAYPTPLHNIKTTRRIVAGSGEVGDRVAAMIEDDDDPLYWRETDRDISLLQELCSLLLSIDESQLREAEINDVLRERLLCLLGMRDSTTVPNGLDLSSIKTFAEAAAEARSTKNRRELTRMCKLARCVRVSNGIERLHEWRSRGLIAN